MVAINERAPDFTEDAYIDGDMKKISLKDASGHEFSDWICHLNPIKGLTQAYEGYLRYRDEILTKA